MKKLVVVLVVAVAAVVGYQYVQTGSLPLLSGAPSSEEERKVAALEDEFKAAQTQFSQAGRQAGMGVDTTSDLDAAISRVRRVRRSLDALKKTLKDPAARTRAAKLDELIRLFEKKVD